MQNRCSHDASVAAIVSVCPIDLLLLKPLGIWTIGFLLICLLRIAAHADPVPVRSAEGTIHGFLEVRSEDGQIVASGDVVRVVRGSRATTRTVFHFKDGSIDDETTVFSQLHTFQLISDHHIQKGPSFPHPMDVMIDVHSGQVTVHTTGKDGKDQGSVDHLQLPPDVANGIVPVIVENLHPNAPTTSVSLVVATPKPRLVKLIISRAGEENSSVAGYAEKATHYDIKIDLGKVAGAVAPLIGKAPPDIHIWTIGGEVTTFAREKGPLYPEGPIMTIQLASPSWPDTATAAH